LTRHELKERLAHDQFTDVISGIVSYTSSHRQQAIRWLIAAIVVLALAGAGWWYRSNQSSLRQQDLAAALSVLQAQVGPPNEYAKTFLTEELKQQAALKELTGIVAKYSGTHEGLIAQYYRGTLKAQRDDVNGAQSDLRVVADSGSECAPLAKIALAQLFAGQKKTAEAQKLLRSIVNAPTDLVSKAQAQILLAELDQTVDPREAKDILKSIEKVDHQRPAVTRAADEVSAQLSK
jgi:predicted negative regulator of RcsB-dependent stress response